MRVAPNWLLVLVACSAQATADTKIQTTQTRSPQWVIKGDLVVAPAPDGVPPVSAGCLTIFHHVLADGSVAKPQVLRGAFTANISDAQRALYTTSALESTAAWQFVPTKANTKSRPGFTLETIGFVPGVDAGQMHNVSNAEGMPKNLRDQCEVIDLAAWGEANAIPIEKARVRNGDKVILDDPDHPSVAWIARKMPPPGYPRLAAAQGIEGCVVVGITIQADGVPGDFRIMGPQRRSHPNKMLEDSAIAAASTWRFSPGPENLGRIPEFTQIPVQFHLDAFKSGRPANCTFMDVREVIESAPAQPPA